MEVSEEAELGIYEDKGSGTDLSDSELVKSREKINEEDVAPLSCVTTPTPRLNEPTENTKPVKEKQIEFKTQPENQELSPPATQVTTKNVVENLTGRRNSVDPALEIKGILKTHPSRQSRQSSPAKFTLNVQEPTTVAVPPSSANRDLISAARSIDYIEKKCVGTITRRNSSYHFRESPWNAAGSAHSRHVFLPQNKPSPMAPLKAWKGYSGNIYFDPIKIRRVNSANGVIETVSRSQVASATPSAEPKKPRHQTAKPDLNALAYHCDCPPKPAIIMDKGAVLNKTNRDLQEDLEWIRNTEHVGSLKIEQGPGDSRAKERKFNHKNVRKGSVAHELAQAKKNSNKPVQKAKKMFSVSGDRYTAPSYMNPLLKSSTQYTQSVHRPISCSPELSRHSAGLDRLPPLEQMKASLRNQSSTKTTSHNRRVKIITDSKVPSYVKLNKSTNNLQTAVA